MKGLRKRKGFFLGLMLTMTFGGCKAGSFGQDGPEAVMTAGMGKLCEAAKTAVQEEDIKDTDLDTEEYAPGGTDVPTLAMEGREPADFVPEGWELMDSAELDFNEDGAVDYVGVLERAEPGNGDGYDDTPRILFGIASEKGQYRLDFQDVNLIRTKSEGGVYGDPYLPLTAEGTSFTTHAFGGSAWKWSEDYTYTYKEGTWYLTRSEDSYGYGWYTTSYSMNDWEKGVGERKKRSSDFDDMEKHWDEEEPPYDLVYEVSLDEPFTIQEAGKRWWLSLDRVDNWSVDSLKFAAGVELEKPEIEFPSENIWYDYCDENCALYSFSQEEGEKSYLAMYSWQDRSLSVLAGEESEIDNIVLYKGKIYYSTEIREDIAYREFQDGEARTVREQGTVGVSLHRINTDGTEKEQIFKYRIAEADQEIMEAQPPYLALISEIGGDEIVLEVYNGNAPHPFYRMNTDGSGLQFIGQVPKSS